MLYASKLISHCHSEMLLPTRKVPFPLLVTVCNRAAKVEKQVAGGLKQGRILSITKYWKGRKFKVESKFKI